MNEKGFTLIELVSVIVLLGILAAAALPRFVNLSGDANKSVTSSVRGSFYSAANLFHMKWLTQGQPASLTINGNNVLMSAEGYPDLPTANTAGCLEIWNDIMQTSINIVAYPGNGVATPEWSALRIFGICVYINHNGSVFSSTVTPFFSYFHITVGTNAAGTGAGFNLD